MVLVVVCGAAPLIAVAWTGGVPRSVLSASPLLLAGGARVGDGGFIGDGGLGLGRLPPGSPIVATTARLALFTALFTVPFALLFTVPFAGGRRPSFRAGPCPAAFESLGDVLGGSPGGARGGEPGPPPAARTQEAGHARP